MKRLIWLPVFAMMVGAATSHSFASEKISEEFKLYHKANYQPNPGCNVWTSLEINYVEKSATLKERVNGLCGVMINPNPRTYALTFPKDPNISTGDIIISGVRPAADDRQDRLVIKDHRQNTIGFFVSRLEVSEKPARGPVRKLYSYDQSANTSMNTLWTCSLKWQANTPMTVRIEKGGISASYSAQITQSSVLMRNITEIPMLNFKAEEKNKKIISQTFFTPRIVEKSFELVVDLTRRLPSGSYPAVLDFSGSKSDMVCEPARQVFPN